MNRISVVGCSGSGKTTFAVRLAVDLDAPHVELDELHWGPDWIAASSDELVARVSEATAREGWIVDGNYQSKIGSLVWERADTVVWLDPPRWRVMRQVISRTATRVVRRRELWNGNRERWSGFAVWRGEKSVIWWAWTSYGKVSKTYADAMADPALTHLTWHRLRSRSDVEKFMKKMV